MLWFNHPKQVGSGRAVAVQVVQRRAQTPHTAFLTLPDRTPPPLCGEAVAAPGVRLHLRLKLGDYLPLALAHARWLMQRKRVGAVTAALVRPVFGALAAFDFALRRRKVGPCTLTLDENGVVRAGRDGHLHLAWSEVRALRTYGRGYLLLLKRGALPIPYADLTREQRAAMTGYAAAFGAGALH